MSLVYFFGSFATQPIDASELLLSATILISVPGCLCSATPKKGESRKFFSTTSVNKTNIQSRLNTTPHERLADGRKEVSASMALIKAACNEERIDQLSPIDREKHTKTIQTLCTMASDKITKAETVIEKIERDREQFSDDKELWDTIDHLKNTN